MLDKAKLVAALEHTTKQFESTSKQYGELSIKDAGKSEFLTIMISDLNKGIFDAKDNVSDGHAASNDSDAKEEKAV